MPLMTAEEFVRKHGGDHAELVKGVFKQLAMISPAHGYVNANAAHALLNFVKEHELGIVCGNDSFVRIPGTPDTVRGGDICYYSYSRLPKGELHDGLLDVGPELIFEIRAPPDDWCESLTKVTEFFIAGVLAVGIVDLDTESVTVLRPNARPAVLENTDILTLPDILPGFSVPVRKLFE